MMKKSKKMLAVSVAALAALAVTAAPVSAAERVLAGSDRYQTAISVAKAGWTSSDYAVLAPGETNSMVDALASAPLAKAYNAPILLTWGTALHSDTLAQLKKLGVKTVFVTSGTISPSVKSGLKAAGMKVEEVYGANRYATSVAIATKIKAVKPLAGSFIVNGSGKDALSAGSIAAGKGMSILYTYDSAVPTEVSNFLKANAGTNYVLGGTGVVNDSVMKSVNATKRLAGADRYQTSAAILNEFKADLDLGTVYVAPGNDENLVDALTISALAAKGTKSNPVVIAMNDLKGNEMKATLDFLKVNMGNATVKVVGNTFTAANEAIINGLKVVSPEAKITNIKVEAGLTAFDRYVEVTIDSATPEKATVKFGNVTLKYDAAKKIFIGLVPASDDAIAKDVTKYTVTVAGVPVPPVVGTVTVKDITVASGLTAFDRYVEVSLNTAAPEKATVKYGNVTLKYDAAKKIFIGLVPTSDDAVAKDASKYTVTSTEVTTPVTPVTPVVNAATVKTVTAASGLTAFDRYVEVTLDTTTPEKFNVKYGNTTLKFDASKKIFIGLVPTSDDAVAKDASKYSVTVK